MGRLQTSRPPDLPAGWHPDPWTEGKLLRYWDGRQWTPQTKDASAPPTPRRKRSVVFPLTFAAFLLATVVVAISMTRSDVGKVTVGPMSVEFNEPGIAAAQPQIDKQLTSAQQEASSKATTGPAPSADVSGGWSPSDGSYVWTIYQYGSQLVVQESTTYGVTGVGQGSLSGDTLVVDFRAWDGSVGRAQLQMVGTGRLSGTIANYTHNVQGQLTLTRR